MNLTPLFYSLESFFICLLQIPIYLLFRNNIKEPIHSIGLNSCFLLTTTQYTFLFVIIKLLTSYCGPILSSIFITLTVLGTCYALSTMSAGKLFLGKRKEQGKYGDVYRYVQDNPYCATLIDYELYLRKTDETTYEVFNCIFREDRTWDDTMERANIWERKELDKEIYAIYKTLKALLEL